MLTAQVHTQSARLSARAIIQRSRKGMPRKRRLLIRRPDPQSAIVKPDAASKNQRATALKMKRAWDLATA
jgi:hypothetical protein